MSVSTVLLLGEMKDIAWLIVLLFLFVLIALS
jgi:hypothetical protein